jgi:hypothetical protein
MPLTSLDLHNCVQVRDLAPLKGMKLTNLYIFGCAQVRDLTPLQGHPLVELYFNPKNITQGMDVLRSMKSLRAIVVGNGPTDRYATEQFWKKYDAGEFK